MTAERQQHVNELAKELQPVNGERKKWQDDDKAWKATLEKKTKGESCMLLGVDSMGRNLYDTVFTMMAQYGFKATFTLKDGQLPISPDVEEASREYIDTEQFREMLDAGWEYGISVSEREITGEDAGEDDWLTR
ncbi:hypothetical protein NSB04_04180, partial [Blautia pseudococcoides]|nr:hypothetical protein [Blautia pseudococcoides]